MTNQIKRWRRWAELPSGTQEEIRNAVRHARASSEPMSGPWWDRLGEPHQITGEALRRVLDLAWADKRRAQINAWRASGGADPAGAVRPPDIDTRRRAGAVPDDTRSLTGKIFGDPLPGRSALDRDMGRRG
jgi:hypothetical protein